jgi:hypothetical protein
VVAVETATIPEAVIAPVATEPKAKRTRKIKKAKASKGRPPVYVGDLRKGIVKLLKQHKNATHVRAILSASGKRKADLVTLREDVGLTEKVNISMPTLLKVASAAGIELHRGRPVVKAA